MPLIENLRTGLIYRNPKPHVHSVHAYFSHDQGATWPAYLDVMREAEGAVYFWESKIVELADGRLLATAWAYDDVVMTEPPEPIRHQPRRRPKLVRAGLHGSPGTNPHAAGVG